MTATATATATTAVPLDVFRQRNAAGFDPSTADHVQSDPPTKIIKPLLCYPGDDVVHYLKGERSRLSACVAKVTYVHDDGKTVSLHITRGDGTAYHRDMVPCAADVGESVTADHAEMEGTWSPLADLHNLYDEIWKEREERAAKTRQGDIERKAKLEMRRLVFDQATAPNADIDALAKKYGLPAEDIRGWVTRGSIV